MLKRGSPRLSSQLAKLDSWLTGQAKINKDVDERDNTEHYHVAPRLHVNPSPYSCPSVFLSLRSIPRCICTINCVFLVFHFLPHMPPSTPLPLLHSVAAVLVMALCPWCKLAAGSQVAHMTVIDVQVFNSSHTETLEQHTCIRGYR